MSVAKTGREKGPGKSGKARKKNKAISVGSETKEKNGATPAGMVEGPKAKEVEGNNEVSENKNDTAAVAGKGRDASGKATKKKKAKAGGSTTIEKDGATPTGEDTFAGLETEEMEGSREVSTKSATTVAEVGIDEHGKARKKKKAEALGRKTEEKTGATQTGMVEGPEAKKVDGNSEVSETKNDTATVAGKGRDESGKTTKKKKAKAGGSKTIEKEGAAPTVEGTVAGLETEEMEGTRGVSAKSATKVAEVGIDECGKARKKKKAKALGRKTEEKNGATPTGMVEGPEAKKVDGNSEVSETKKDTATVAGKGRDESGKARRKARKNQKSKALENKTPQKRKKVRGHSAVIPSSAAQDDEAESKEEWEPDKEEEGQGWESPEVEEVEEADDVNDSSEGNDYCYDVLALANKLDEHDDAAFSGAGVSLLDKGQRNASRGVISKEPEKEHKADISTPGRKIKAAVRSQTETISDTTTKHTPKESKAAYAEARSKFAGSDFEWRTSEERTL